MVDLSVKLCTLCATGRAGNEEFLHSPKRMLSYRFQILRPLLILWQLILPVSAPWLHSCVETGCTTACGLSLSEVGSHQPGETQGRHSCACCFHQAQQTSSDSSDQSSPAKKPHDCSNCAVCRAIAAPRTPVAIVVLALTSQTVCSIVKPDCANPSPGFGLPPQCRAPPVCNLRRA